MSELNQTPSALRTHIAFFGRRNVGKSSLVNAFTGQAMSIVSDIKGTTTDPVSKAMELLPLGPVQIIDTPGIDDEGALGTLRVQRTRQVLEQTDIAVLVTDSVLGAAERELIALFEAWEIPYLIVYNKADLFQPPVRGLSTCALTGQGVAALKDRVAALTPGLSPPPLVSDLVQTGDTAVLVVPIDSAAPKGRLILPQQLVIRELLDSGASALVCRDSELETTMQALSKPPKLVITDSQVFAAVDAAVPDGIRLTSFSILMARQKGDLPLMVQGVTAVDTLQTGDRVLVCEGCTHRRQCQDIGTVKLPDWIRRHTGARPDFTFVSGKDFPDDVSGYKMVIHCGGCMLTHRQMRRRLQRCKEQNIPVTNYGVLIAHLHGILQRSLSAFN